MPGRIGQIGHHLNGFPPNSTRHHLNELGGQIGWKSIEITLYACLVEVVELGGQIGWKSIELTRHMRQMMPNSTRHHLNELGGRIGWKSIEITLYACLVKSVKLGGQIGQIGWKSIESTRHMRQMMPNSTRHHLNGFPPNSTRHHLNESGG